MRVRLLEKVEMMINTVSCEIKYLSSPTDEVVSMLSHRKEFNELKFLRYCYLEMTNGSDFRSAWHKAFCFNSNLRYFDKTDISVLDSFGNQFGTTDGEGQISICSMYLDLIRENIKDAKAQRERYASLSSGIGLLAGIGVIIVFV